MGVRENSWQNRIVVGNRTFYLVEIIQIYDTLLTSGKMKRFWHSHWPKLNHSL